MNCKKFKENIDYFIENDVSQKIDSEMKTHMKHCDSCRRYYEDKMRFHKILQNSFNTESIKFKSNKLNIMNAIDKNRYKNGKMLKYNLLKYKKQFISIAAVLILSILFIPFALQKLNINTSNNNENLQSIKQKEVIADKRASVKSSSASDNKKELKDEINKDNLKKEFKFTKKEDKEEKIDFNTPWVKSPNNENELCINGRGEYSVEEAIGKICIRNLKNNKTYIYTMSDTKSQFSPIKAFWYDDEDILVIVGLGYGTLSYGGDLYILNINTSKSKLLVSPPESERIIEAKKDKDKIKMKVMVFKDKEFNKYDIVDKEIKISDIGIDKIINEISK